MAGPAMAPASGSPEPASLRVAIVNRHPADGPGGSEVQCDLLARGLVARGHSPLYVAPHRVLRPIRSIAPASAYPVLRVPQWGRAIAACAIDAEADVVYWRFNKRGLRTAMRRLAARGVPVVFAVSHVNDVTPWGVKPVGGGRARAALASIVLRVVGRWQHAGLKRAAAMTTNNPDLLDTLAAPIRAHVANGMIDDAVPFTWPRPFCIWVGSIKASKRPEAAVRLAAEIADFGVDVLMVGGVQDRGYEAIIAGRGLPENLHYLGMRTLEEVNGMFAAAQLHVHTCLPEGFSNVFIQAWLQGCPSVSLGFDPGGHLERERMGGDAHDDWNRFVALVRGLLADERARMDAGQRARAFAAERFGVERMVDEIEALLLDAARRARA